MNRQRNELNIAVLLMLRHIWLQSPRSGDDVNKLTATHQFRFVFNDGMTRSFALIMPSSWPVSLLLLKQFSPIRFSLAVRLHISLAYFRRSFSPDDN